MSTPMTPDQLLAAIHTRLDEMVDDALGVHYAHAGRCDHLAGGGNPCDCGWPKSIRRQVEGYRRVLARHEEHYGRCVACLERCDCMEHWRVSVDEGYEALGRAWSDCTHGNEDWPCGEVRDLAFGLGIDTGEDS